MKNLLILVFLFLSSIISAQTKTDGIVQKAKEINLSDTSIKDYAPALLSSGSQPVPSSEYGTKKAELYKKRLEAQKAKKKKRKWRRSSKSKNPAAVRR